MRVSIFLHRKGVMHRIPALLATLMIFAAGTPAAWGDSIAYAISGTGLFYFGEDDPRNSEFAPFSATLTLTVDPSAPVILDNNDPTQPWYTWGVDIDSEGNWIESENSGASLRFELPDFSYETDIVVAQAANGTGADSMLIAGFPSISSTPDEQDALLFSIEGARDRFSGTDFSSIGQNRFFDIPYALEQGDQCYFQLMQSGGSLELVGYIGSITATGSIGELTNVTVIPEPSAYAAMMGAAFAAFVGFRRRRKT